MSSELMRSTRPAVHVTEPCPDFETFLAEWEELLRAAWRYDDEESLRLAEMEVRRATSEHPDYVMPWWRRRMSAAMRRELVTFAGVRSDLFQQVYAFFGAVPAARAAAWEWEFNYGEYLHLVHLYFRDDGTRTSAAYRICLSPGGWNDGYEKTVSRYAEEFRRALTPGLSARQAADREADAARLPAAQIEGRRFLMAQYATNPNTPEVEHAGND